MPETPSDTLKKTPLNARHRSLGARMVEFGGWDMPVEYSGLADEHLAVRTRAGLFDVSHMGEIEIAGKDALAAVQHITCNDAGKLAINQAQYSALTTPQGTFVDDVLTYKVADVRATISRTGYTGEDGFEVFVPPASAERVWDAIQQAGRGAGVLPAGLRPRATPPPAGAVRPFGNTMG